MGIVTAINQQERNPERVNIFIDGEFRFGIAKVLATGLKQGQELSVLDIEALLLKEEVEKAYGRALDLIGRRPHATEEIRLKLKRKLVSSDTVERVIDRLREAGLLDDQVFSTAWIENQQAFRPRGRKILQLELRKKGVDREIIDAVTKDVDDESAAYRAAGKVSGRYRSLERPVAERRLLAYLARRGFNYGLCRKVVDATLSDAMLSSEGREVEQ